MMVRFYLWAVDVQHLLSIYVYKIECLFVCLSVGMLTINSLTPWPISTKFGVLTNQKPAKNIGYKGILIFIFISVFPLIIISRINHMHHLLGRGGAFFPVRSEQNRCRPLSLLTVFKLDFGLLDPLLDFFTSRPTSHQWRMWIIAKFQSPYHFTRTEYWTPTKSHVHFP
jgi:hypothetical protein